MEVLAERAGYVERLQSNPSCVAAGFCDRGIKPAHGGLHGEAELGFRDRRRAEFQRNSIARSLSSTFSAVHMVGRKAVEIKGGVARSATT